MEKIKNFIRLHGMAGLLCLIVLVISCTDKFDDINTNKNALANLETSQLPFLFSKAEQFGTNSGWSYQVAQNLFHDQYAQYFSNSTTYFPSDRLVIRMDWIGSLWSPLYTTVMPQLLTIQEKSDPASAEYALADIWWVVAFHRVTDTWGPIPYFQVGQPTTGVPYDPQDLIYDDFFKRLDRAITVLEGKAGESPFGDFDLIYGGDVSKWIKFANTLRLRLAVRISKVDPNRAKSEGEAAVASGVMTTSPDDDALILKSNVNGDINGLSVMDWNEFRMSSAMESVLKGYDDPRMEVYFNPTLNSITANEEANGGKYNPDDLAHPLEYNGMPNGLSSGQMALDLNKADANSRHGARWNSASSNINFLGKDYPSGLAVSSNVMAAAEAWFLRAEGALLNWNMGGGSAKEYYEAGIKASMNQWGITDDAVITAYINSTDTPIPPMDALNQPALSDVPVLFSTDPAIQQRQITLQKWLALYPDGTEAWADIRRSGFKLYPVANSDNPDLTDPKTQSIRRINFMLSEKQTNGLEVEKAVPLIGPGGDKITTPLWWDKN
ncbi:MAG: SusD/RagB family nutrient-binding outer membrane lipoprotein [Chryseosolibacter sp.]